MFDVQFDGSITSYSTAGTINNFGTFRKSGGSGTLSHSAILNNTGLLEIQNGKIILYHSGNIGSNVSISSGCTLEFRGNYTINETINLTGNGTINIPDQTVTISGTSTGVVIPTTILLTMSGGQINGTGKLTINGTMNWTGGVIADVGIRIISNGATLNLLGSGAKLFYNGTLNNYGTINWSAGDLGLQYGCTFNNQAGGLFDVQFDGSITSYSTAGTINNFGTFRKSGGSGTLSHSAILNNTGLLEIQNGKIILYHSGNIGSNVSISSGCTLEFRGNYTINETINLTGNGTINIPDQTVTISGTSTGVVIPSTILLAMSGGVINGTGKLTINGIMNWTGGTINDNGQRNISNGATLNIFGTAVKYFKNGTLNNSGTINWTAGEFSLQYGCTFNNQSDGLFDIQLDGNITTYSDFGTINNSGTIKKSRGTGTTNVYVNLHNNGLTEIDSGNCYLYANGNHSGTFDLDNSTNLVFNGGTHNLNIGSQLLGSGTLVVNCNTSNNNTSGFIVPLNATLKVTAGTFAGNGQMTINGKFSLGDATLSHTNNFTYGAYSTLEYIGNNSRTASVKEFPTSPTKPYNLIIDNSSTIYLNNAKILAGTLTLNKGTLNSNGYELRLENNATIVRNLGSISTYQPTAYYNYNVTYINTSNITSGLELSLQGSPQLANLTLNGTATVNLGFSLYVNDTVKFISGKLNTGSYILYLRDTTILTGEKTGSYLVGNIEITKAIGTSASDFNGIGLQVNAGADNLGNVTVRRTSGVDGRVTVGSKSGIDRKWIISSTNPPTNGRQLTFNWVSDDDNGKNLNSMKVWKSVNGTTWTSVGGLQDASSRSININTTSFSEWTISDNNNPLYSTLANVKVFLQGPFSGGTMQTQLNSGGYIPLNQPYNVSPWYYNGTESVTSIPSDVVDWVLLEIRSNTTTVTAKRAAFLKSDGTVVELDGTSQVSVGVNDGDYYVVVYHRNHLPIMSSNTTSISGSSTLYNFTTGQDKAYGTEAMKDLGSGSFGMYAGDGNASGNVSSVDRNSVWRPQNGTNGYLMGDFNLSGGVSSTDRNSFWRVNNGKNSQVPAPVLKKYEDKINEIIE